MSLPSMRSGLVSREFLRIAGGFGVAALGKSPAGGLDIDNAGNLATDGDITTKGEVDVQGGKINNTIGDLTLDAQNDAADSTIYLKNSDGTYKANVDVEGDLEVGGALTLGADGVNKTWSVWLGPETAILGATTFPSGPIRTWNGDFGGNFNSLDFDKATREFASWCVGLPADYDGSALQATVFWTSTGGTVGDSVVWRVRLGAFADNEDPAQSLTDIGGVIIDALQTLNRVHVITSSAGTPLLASTGGVLMVNVDRQADFTEFDDLDADAKLLGVLIAYA